MVLRLRRRLLLPLHLLSSGEHRIEGHFVLSLCFEGCGSLLCFFLFGISFKLSKLQLAGACVELLGELCGRDGIEAVPAKIEAAASWPEITSPTQLQEFFGFVNWPRPHLGVTFRAESHPLRIYLR